MSSTRNKNQNINQKNLNQKKREIQEEYLQKRQKYLSNPNYIYGNNIFQSLSLSWLSVLISLGYSQPLDQNLLPRLKEEDKSSLQLKRFNLVFQKYKGLHQNNFEKTFGKILLKSLAYYYRKQLAAFLLLCALLVSAQLYNSIYSFNVIMYIGQESNRSQSQNIKYFFIFVFINLGIVLLHNYLEYGIIMKAISFMNILKLMIYEKLLKYPLISSKQFEVSEILNYSQIDIQRLEVGSLYFKEVIRSIFLFFAAIILLFVYIGISFLIGLSVLFLFCIFSYILVRVIVKANKKFLERTDDRIKVAEEILQIIKYIKVNALEEYFLDKIAGKRKEQLKKKKKMGLSHAFDKFIHSLSPSFVVFITLFAFISINNQMSTGKAFFLILVFKNIQFCLQRFPETLNQLISCYVSLKRIQIFLVADEAQKLNSLPSAQQQNYGVIIQNGSFLWQKQIGNTQEDKENKEKKKLKEKNDQNEVPETEKKIMTSQQNIHNEEQNQIKQFPQVRYNNKSYFRVLNEINLKFKKNQTTMIIGDIGSGKTSLLYAILNQMVVQHNSASKIKVNGSIAFCSQKAWIMNGTVKQNILFHLQYDQQRFKDAIYYSCLQEDIKIIPDGIDSTIGEKGINLSGGQKARVSLARALYADKDIYLLDDVLSAVDVHVGSFLMEKTIKGYLKNKTVIMPTHAVKFLEKADKIVLMNKGKVEICGTYQELNKQSYLKKILKSEQLKNEEKFIAKVEQKQITKKLNIEMVEKMPKSESKNADLLEQLMLPEQKQSGQVSSRVYLQYVKLNGGKTFILVIFLMMSGWVSFLLISSLQISKWCDDEGKSKRYLYFYIGYAVISSTFLGINFVYLTICQLRAGNSFFNRVMKAVIYADLNQFFNRVPMGRILNRLGKDVAELDEITSVIFSNIVLCFFSMTASLVMSVIISTPFVLIPIFAVFTIWLLLLNYYIRSQRECLRLEKIANSPVIVGLSELTTGIETIRAYNVGKQFSNKYNKSVDNSKRINIIRRSLEYWFNCRAYLISLAVNYSVFAYCIFTQSSNPSQLGIILTFISTFFDDVQFFLYWFILYRLKMISIERLLNFANIQPEKGYQNPIKNQKGTINKSEEGKIQFINFSSRYRKGLPFVSKNISLSIQPKKKVGIVGRTGAGKSTLFNCILRFLEPVEGELFINGKQIRNYDLKELRNCITMIEQEPTLMNTTFRSNLDPANLYSEQEIKSVLKECNLIKMIENKGGLDAFVTNSTISIGQKQILCLCRGILKKSKIVLIDEATANIDVVNDQLIQQMIRKGFIDSTVLTIAHRLSTLEDFDQILVLGQGQILEWGEEKQLKSRQDGIYRKMWLQNDKSYLF